MELGLMFWANRESRVVLEEVRDFGLRAGQLGVPPELDCRQALEAWKSGLAEFDFAATSAVCCYAGEDYSHLETIHATVGFTAEALRAERVARTNAVSDFARALGIPGVSCHIGFIPSDPAEALYQDLANLTRSLCDYCGGNGQNFVLETGQESAEVLLAFVAFVGRENLKVNFDPANMIMYRSGDPLAALRLLAPHVISVHCKDARSPEAADHAEGFLGAECALGEGDVDFPGFLLALRQIGYTGALSIERETPDPAKRMADIRTGVSRLQGWKADLGL
jgi:sugar phosphate isomerase/epimerase